MGVSWQEFWKMNPHIFRLIARGHEEKVKEKDALNWYLGQYFASALDATVCNNTLWRKKGSKPNGYIKKPIMSELASRQKKETNIPLTEDEKRKKTEQLFMRLQLMGANFNLNHKDGKVS